MWMCREVSLRATEAVAAELGVCVVLKKNVNASYSKEIGVPLSYRQFKSRPTQIIQMYQEDPGNRKK